MKPAPFQLLHELLDKDIQQRLDLLARMTQCLRHHLPGYFINHCWVGGIEKGILSLVVDQAILQTQLHFEQHRILRALNQEFEDALKHAGNRLRRMEVKVTAQKMKPSHTASNTK